MLPIILKDIKARLRTIKRKNFPSVIQVQTTSSCNARCTCCPHNIIMKELPVRVMPDSLFHKIIDECSGHGMEKVSLYLFNEPLLDAKIIERLKYSKAKLPGSKLQISTNVSLLTKNRAGELANIVDYIYLSIQGGISNRQRYEETMHLDYDTMLRNVTDFIELIKNNNYKLKLNNVAINNVIAFESESELEKEKDFWKKNGITTLNFGGFSTWGNIVQSDPGNYSDRIRGCSLKHRPLSHIHVVENGDVILCCRDWERKYILGNVEKNTIAEIWNSPQYKEIISVIYQGGNASADFICYHCEDAIRV